MTFDEIANRVLNQAIDSVQQHQDAVDYSDRLRTKIREYMGQALKQAYKDAIYCFAVHKPSKGLVVGVMERPYNEVSSELDRIGAPYL